MKGHEHIIAMRRRRVAPKIIFLNDWPCRTDWFEFDDHATVCVHGDWPNRADLRFVKGLTVSVSANTEERAKAWAQACKDAGAACVAACAHEAGKPPWEQNGWAEVWREAVHA